MFRYVGLEQNKKLNRTSAQKCISNAPKRSQFHDKCVSCCRGLHQCVVVHRLCRDMMIRPNQSKIERKQGNLKYGTHDVLYHLFLFQSL